MSGFEDQGLPGLTRQAAEAGAALAAVQAPAEKAAAAIDAAFAKAGSSLSRSLGRAAADGKLSLGELAQAVIGAVNAGFGAQGGLSGAVSAAVGAVFSGARADGGPVMAGGAYLVGERGPEIFRPSGGGEIGPAAAGGVTVNLTVQGEGGAAMVRSDAQLAQALARAVGLGARRL